MGVAARAEFERHQRVREVVPVDDEGGAAEKRDETARRERGRAGGGLQEHVVGARKPRERQRRELEELEQNARREGEDAREVPREPGGGRGDEVQVDPRLAQNLRTRRRSRVRDDVHVEPSLLRERERVVLHARGPAEVAEDDHLDAPARARAGRHRARE